MKVNEFQLVQAQENSDFDPFALNDEPFQKLDFPLSFTASSSLPFAPIAPTLSVPPSIQAITGTFHTPIVIPSQIPVIEEQAVASPPQIRLRQQGNAVLTYIDNKLFIDAKYVLQYPQRALAEISRAIGDLDTAHESKTHFSWSAEKHEKFALAACAFGIETVAPRQILEVFGDAQITRESIASHLQKFRLAMIRKYKLNGIVQLRNYHVPDDVAGMNIIKEAWMKPGFLGFTEEEIIEMLKQ